MRNALKPLAKSALIVLRLTAAPKYWIRYGSINNFK